MTETTMTEVPKARRRSVSQLLSYSSCGEAYRLERRAKAPQKPAAWFMQGTAYHAAIEAWENSQRKMSLEDVKNLFLTEYITEANATLEKHPVETWLKSGTKKTETDLTDRQERGLWQVQDYIRLAISEKTLWEVVASEVEFTVYIYGIEYFGYIDQIRRSLVSGRHYAVDLKTGNNVPPTPVQLAIYDLALQQMGYVVTGYAEWCHAGKPAVGKSKERLTENKRVELGDWPVERIGRWAYDMDEAERHGIYLPNPTAGCDRTCGVAQWCRAKSPHLPSVQQYIGDLMDPYNSEENL